MGRMKGGIDVIRICNKGRANDGRGVVVFVMGLGEMGPVVNRYTI